jgi:hypothetical protein
MLDRRLLSERRFHCLSRVNLRRQLEMACIPNNMALSVGIINHTFPLCIPPDLAA